MNLLEAGVDISTIAIWLGHESIETTHKYMVADLRLKEQALAQTKEPHESRFRYQPPDDILNFLDSL
jgi:site-specific recombinase XerD